jgi:formylglycine-generating enzyme required for sulfatase activity
MDFLLTYSRGLLARGHTALLAGLLVLLPAHASEVHAADAARPMPGAKWTVPELELALVPIPAGSFTMGSPADERGRQANEGPQTQVTISKPFWLGATEVTQQQWETLMGSNPSHHKKGAQYPVEMVSWIQAVEFCAKLTERERAAGRIPEGYAYALPTEAQWEYACRAGTTGPHHGKIDDVAWHFKATEGENTKPVGQKQPNAWGLFDLHGNVWEWCADWFGPYSGGKQTDPRGAASGSIRVVRGGSYGEKPVDSRSAFRAGFKPERQGNSVGFRVALRAAQ